MCHPVHGDLALTGDAGVASLLRAGSSDGEHSIANDESYRCLARHDVDGPLNYFHLRTVHALDATLPGVSPGRRIHGDAARAGSLRRITSQRPGLNLAACIALKLHIELALDRTGPLAGGSRLRNRQRRGQHRRCYE